MPIYLLCDIFITTVDESIIFLSKMWEEHY